MAKNPVIAAVLNFFLFGLGYIYIGKKRIFALILFLGNVAFLTAFALGLVWLNIHVDRTYLNTNGVGFVLIRMAFAYDAYQLAKDFPSIS